MWPRLAKLCVAYIRACDHGRHSSMAFVDPGPQTYEQLLQTVMRSARAISAAADTLMHQALETVQHGNQIDCGRWDALQRMSDSLNLSQVPQALHNKISPTTRPRLIISPISTGWGPNGLIALNALYDAAENIHDDIQTPGSPWAGKKTAGRKREPDRQAFIIDLAELSHEVLGTSFSVTPGNASSNGSPSPLGRFIGRVFEILGREDVVRVPMRLEKSDLVDLKTMHRYLKPLRDRKKAGSSFVD